MKVVHKDKMSFSEIRQMVCDAICAKEGKDFHCYVEDIFDDAVVYESTGTDGMTKCYQRSYSISAGKVTLGDAVEVQKEITYVPLKAACVLMAAVDGGGAKWRVQVVEFGPDKNGVNWDKTALTAALPLFEGAKVFALNASQHQDPKTASRFGKSPRELIGALTAAVIGKDGVYADLVIMPSADWLQKDLQACQEHDIDYVYGLSVDVKAKTKKMMVDGKQMVAPDVIQSVQVDVVYNPAAGGKFIQLAAAVQAGQEEDEMLFKKLLAAVQGKNPTLYAQITAGIAAGTMTEDTAIQQIAAAAVTAQGGDANDEKLVASVVTALTASITDQTGADTLQQMQLMACRMTLDTTLTASGLPVEAQKLIRNRFTNQVFEESTLQAAIKETKEAFDSFTGSGRVTGAGDARVRYESTDKLQAAVDQMLGVKVADDLRTTAPGFTSLRAAYVEMTGDTDVTGVITPENARRLQAAYDGTTFAYALGNTLYRRVAQDYREIQDYGVSRLVGNNIRNARDFRNLETLIIGYYGDLPTVDTDVNDYPDLGEVGDEMVEYALMEQGGIITIKRKTIINDDLRLVERIISRLGRGARRGVARKVWTPFLTNANWKGDNKAIFHADHGNLGSTAYGIASALAAKVAMAQQTEPGSNERLLLRPSTVSFPSELFGIVRNVNTYNPQAVAIENGNSMYGFFKEEGLFENPLMTDANDWMMFADPNEIEIVELAFLNGQQEPQMFIANNPTQGQMFVNGGLQYKIQHDYNAEVIDFRGAYKAVVA